MTPDDFIRKWKASTLSERSAAHSHFLDLCGLLGEATPTDTDQTGDSYTFEKGATKTTGGKGWADVWKRGCFAWEYKGKHKNLTTAFAQLQQYTPVLENPPLLVVSDMEWIEIHTNWTATVAVVHRLSIDDLRNADTRALLKAVFSNPETLKPGLTRQALTEDVARKFAQLAMRLQGRGHDPQEVAHFVNRLVFCMFAEDVELLPNHLFKRLLQHCLQRPDLFTSMAGQLFSAMRTGGLVGFEQVLWFNGGLFDSDAALPLDKEDLKQVLAAATLDWGQIDPSILGTLFERGLDPDKRGQLGAHYTDAATIMRLIDPVITLPLTREWGAVRTEAQVRIAGAKRATRTRAQNEAERLCIDFLERLRRFRVLDPACGSGNFLYLALITLKTLEHRVNLDIQEMGFTRQFPSVGPEAVLGIEINPYAAELARVSVWIGEIQWMKGRGFAVSPNPILKPLDNIACRDAVLANDGTPAIWPDVDVIVGNPPFLGDRRMIRALGEVYVDKLRRAYTGRVSGSADFVCYWFSNAQRALTEGRTQRFGLVATRNIQSGSNRQILDAISLKSRIFNAWRDEPWILDGASVRVSLICTTLGNEQACLNGINVQHINSDLTADGSNFEGARVLTENSGISFVGLQKGGPFDISGEQARAWLDTPGNPNGKPNSDVLHPSTNGGTIVGHDPDRWLIDFGVSMPEREAAAYELPFEHVMLKVKPKRLAVRRDQHRLKWWIHGDPRPGLRFALEHLKRYILTPMVSKHRIFVFVDSRILPENKAVAFAKDDLWFFDVLHSKHHELWSRRLCSYIGGERPSYSPSRCFETFPFPYTERCGDLQNRVAMAADDLIRLRDAWLFPPELLLYVPEVVNCYPARKVPKDSTAAQYLRGRTLTTLYNKKPSWLIAAHNELDQAVAAGYGWPSDTSDNDILARLLALNLARAAEQAASPDHFSPKTNSPRGNKPARSPVTTLST